MTTKTKQRRPKIQHEDGVPSLHGFEAGQAIILAGGRVHHDREHGEWVALAVNRVLGRFPTREQAEQAVAEHAGKPRQAPPTTDPNRYEERLEDCDDWRDEDAEARLERRGLGSEEAEIEAWAERMAHISHGGGIHRAHKASSSCKSHSEKRD